MGRPGDGKSFLTAYLAANIQADAAAALAELGACDAASTGDLGWRAPPAGVTCSAAADGTLDFDVTTGGGGASFINGEQQP